MAKVTNTFVVDDAVGNREELSNVVDRVAVEDTPLYSMIQKGRCKTTHPEWETEDLDTPASNAQAEGDEYTFAAVTPATRVGNYTQILRKDFIISGSQDANDNAGGAEKVKHQKLLKGIALRKDVEYAILDNNASVAGETRELGGLPSWITSNVDRGSGGSNGGFSSGSGLTVAATNGTQRAFTKAIMDGVMEDSYTAGANVSDVVLSPYVKSVFVTFMSDSNVASFRYAASGKSNELIANVDVYHGAHGTIKVHMDRIMATSAGLARNVFFIDKSKMAFDWYRPIREDRDVAKTGDAKKCVLLGEGTLRVKNEKGLGVAADVYGLTAST